VAENALDLEMEVEVAAQEVDDRIRTLKRSAGGLLNRKVVASHPGRLQ
jgi:hypothetical protein